MRIGAALNSGLSNTLSGSARSASNAPRPRPSRVTVLSQRAGMMMSVSAFLRPNGIARPSTWLTGSMVLVGLRLLAPRDRARLGRLVLPVLRPADGEQRGGDRRRADGAGDGGLARVAETFGHEAINGEPNALRQGIRAIDPTAFPSRRAASRHARDWTRGAGRVRDPYGRAAACRGGRKSCR